MQSVYVDKRQGIVLFRGDTIMSELTGPIDWSKTYVHEFSRLTLY